MRSGQLPVRASPLPVFEERMRHQGPESGMAGHEPTEIQLHDGHASFAHVPVGGAIVERVRQHQQQGGNEVQQERKDDNGE